MSTTIYVIEVNESDPNKSVGEVYTYVHTEAFHNAAEAHQTAHRLSQNENIFCEVKRITLK